MVIKMSNYTLEGDRFVIENYTEVPAFSSFLPGLSGVKGIPVWSFYTNRGQGINSFGIHNKGNAIMEFNPANTAYEVTPIKGFRTFIRVDGACYEPFCPYDPEVKRRMEIEKNVLTISEENHGLRVTVCYIILPGENIGALVRRVTVENLGNAARELELLDGMPQIIPYGVQNGTYKEMSNLFRSYADVKNIENRAPFYTTRPSSDDSAEVSELQGGYFYLAVQGGGLQQVICDKNVIFGRDSSLVNAAAFWEKGLDGVLAEEQRCVNKIPCGFIPGRALLEAGEKFELAAFSGFASSIELLNEKAKCFCTPGYVERKIREARELAAFYTRDVRTRTSSPEFDQYMEQCYLDNFLRGGIPFLIGKGEHKAVVHLFSRKHGDPERDYNSFSIAGEYYSQGNGNYRDVCQNRRNDVFFNPEVGDFNVRHFYSLVQMDGYNPLEIRPCTFVIPEENREAAAGMVRGHVEDPEGRIAAVLGRPFTPGQITNTIAAYQLKVTGDEEELVNGLIGLGRQQIEARFVEGYWSDHWDYNLDLVENYLLIYPDKRESLLFGDHSYRYYDSCGVVRPRSDTYVLNKGKVRQYGSLYECKEKLERPGFAENGTNWLKDRQGSPVTTTLFGKMMTLAVNKFALLDSFGMGVEMEGGRPGWNDAMNGLPGLFGSGMPETLELMRLVDFLREEVQRHDPEREILLPAELAAFAADIYGLLQEELSDFDYWDRAASRRESFREEIKFEVSGDLTALSFREIGEMLDAFSGKLERGIARAMEYGKGIMPTYFTYEASEFEEVLNEDKTPRISPYGLPSVRVKGFRLVQMPYFLEGPAKMLAVQGRKDRETAAEMCDGIRMTDIYDKKLKMYKTSESIEGLSMENGRVRSFTPGWLERESIFLHMEYKYFLGMLKAGLYDRFYEAVGDALIPYQKPEVYGRSILENSSFLASSANPDPSVHGQGFVARLSGSTVEMLSMWLGMFLGEGGFLYEDGKLGFCLAPRLSGEMFDGNGEVSFMLLGCCKVTYHNRSRENTYGENGVKVRRMELTGESCYTVEGGIMGEEPARKLREGGISEIHAYLD